jgi:hypothetical protein
MVVCMTMWPYVTVYEARNGVQWMPKGVRYAQLGEGEGKISAVREIYFGTIKVRN